MASGDALILDLTRTIARAGLLPTGIDRVEAAWLREVLRRTGPAFGLVQTRIGFLVLDRAGLTELRDRLAVGDLPAPDRIASHSWKDTPRAGAETLARSLAIRRVTPFRVGQAVAGVARRYFNVSHMALRRQTVKRMQRAGVEVTVLIHDTIPLDHPELSRSGSDKRLRRHLNAARDARVLAISDDTAARVRAQLSGCAPVVAPLGVEVGHPDWAEVTCGVAQDDVYFVCLGTIEGRKNVSLLLDVWERLDAPRPKLVLAGRRGWRAEEVFTRLDAGIEGVVEAPDLPDSAIWALLQGAQALLMPSLAEGFGLPPLEAKALGTPSICNNLPVWREHLGKAGVYLNGSDSYVWEQAIRDILANPRRIDASDRVVPDWQSHFRIALGGGDRAC